MTLPHERSMAIELAGELLRDLAIAIPDEPHFPKREEFLARIRHVLRHYPDVISVRRGAQTIAHFAAMHDRDPWIAPIEGDSAHLDVSK